MPSNIPANVSLSISGISAGMGWSYTGKTSTDFSVSTSGFFSYNKNLTTGYGEGQCNLYLANTITIPSDTNVQINLLTPPDDAFGNSFYFTTVRMIYVEVAENSADIVIGGGQNGSGQNAFSTFLGDATDKVKVTAGGVFQLTNPNTTGYPVSGTNSILRFTNADTVKSAVIRYFIAGS